MRLLTAIAAAMIAIWTPDLSHAGEGAYSGIYVKRAVLVVSDLERSLRLWRDVFGMKVESISTENQDSLAYDIFNVPKSAGLRFASLSAGPDQKRTLGIAEVTGVPLPPREGIAAGGVVINANGRVPQLKLAIAEFGLTLMREKPLVTKEGALGIESAFRDWDGNVIVFYDLPGTAPNPPKR